MSRSSLQLVVSIATNKSFVSAVIEAVVIEIRKAPKTALLFTILHIDILYLMIYILIDFKLNYVVSRI